MRHKIVKITRIALAVVILTALIITAPPVKVSISSGVLSLTHSVARAEPVITAMGTKVTKLSAYNKFSLTDGMVEGDWYVIVFSTDVPMRAPTELQTFSGGNIQMTKSFEANNSGQATVSVWILKVPHSEDWNGTQPRIGTASLVNSSSKVLAVYKITGVDDLIVDKTAFATGSGTDASTGSTGTLSYADELVFAATAVEDEIDDPPGTWTTGTGYVSGNELNDATNGGGDSSNQQGHVVAMIVSSTDALQGVDAGHDSTDWAAAIVTYQIVIEGGEPAAEVAPIVWEVGIIEVGSTANTAINYFTATNIGSGDIDIEIKGTDLAGGDDTWDLADNGTPGANIFGLYAGLDDVDDLFDIIIKEDAAYNTLVAGLGESATQDWGMKLYMPTSVPDYDGQVMNSIVTLLVTAS